VSAARTKARSRNAKRALIGGEGDLPQSEAPPASRPLHARMVTWLAPTDLLLAAAIGLWIIAVVQIRPAAINDWGLISALPLAYFAALAVLVGSFAAVLSRSHPSPVRAWLHLAALVAALHAVLPLVLAYPQYAWVYKHFGVVGYIAQHGSVDPSLDIYQNWPGFFALFAWFDKVAGTSSPITYAAWAPLFFNLLALLAIDASFRALEVRDRHRWLALFLFVPANWVGQDYFAPQAFDFVLAEFLLACLLTWFRTARPAGWAARFEQRVGALLRRGTEPPAQAVSSDPTEVRRPVLLAAVFVVFAVVTFSHELSPYMVIAAVLALTLAGLLRPRWMVVAFAAIAGAYLLSRFQFLRSHYDLLLSLNPFQNVQNGAATPNQGVAGRVFTGYAARGLSVLVWALAAFGAFCQARSGRTVMLPVALFLAPFLLVFGQEYGGEAIYRVYLFALPWAVLLAAGGVMLRDGRGWRSWATVALLPALLIGLFLQAYFGLEETNVINGNQIAASLYFEGHAPAGSILVLAGPDFPQRISANYSRYVVTSGAYDPVLLSDRHFRGRALGSADLPAVDAFVLAYRKPGSHAFLAVTSEMKTYCHVFKLAPDGSLDGLQRALAASPRWSVFYANPEVVIFELKEPAAGQTAINPSGTGAALNG